MLSAEGMALRDLHGQGGRTLQQLADTNVGEMIASLAQGIAQAQLALDTTSVRLAQVMSGRYSPQIDEKGRVTLVERPNRLPFLGEQLSLMELGLTPTFYQFVESLLEIKVSVSMSADVEFERRETTRTETRTTSGLFRRKTRTRVHTVSSRFSASYQYSVEGSSYVRTKLVPVPPPGSLLAVMAEAAAGD